MAKGKTLPRIKFLSVSKDIKAAVATNSYNASQIAKKHVLSPETIRAIRRAGTWPKYLNQRLKRNEGRAAKRRLEGRYGDEIVLKSNNGTKALVTHIHRGNALDNLPLALEDQPIKYVTGKELDELDETLLERIAELHLRLDDQLKMINKKRNKFVWPWSRDDRN